MEHIYICVLHCYRAIGKGKVLLYLIEDLDIQAVYSSWKVAANKKETSDYLSISTTNPLSIGKKH